MFNVLLHLSFLLLAFFFSFLKQQFSAACDAFRGSLGGESTNVKLWGGGLHLGPEAFMPTAKWELWFFTVTTT